MFITVEYGDSETLLINANCTAKVFTDYLREKCEVNEKVIVDLTDENASLAEIYIKDPQENVLQYFTPRGNYILCEVELHEDNEDIKKITPMLTDWEKKYQFLERKLKHRDKKNKQALIAESQKQATETQENISNASRLSVKRSERGASRTNANERGGSRSNSRKNNDKDRITEADGTESPALQSPKKQSKNKRKPIVKTVK